jgi:hypothetical protein
MPKQAATWYEEKKGRTKRGKNKVHTKINPRNPQVKKTKKKNNSKNTNRRRQDRAPAVDIL